MVSRRGLSSRDNLRLNNLKVSNHSDGNLSREFNSHRDNHRHSHRSNHRLSQLRLRSLRLSHHKTNLKERMQNMKSEIIKGSGKLFSTVLLSF